VKNRNLGRRRSQGKTISQKTNNNSIEDLLENKGNNTQLLTKAW
jgi:hypothetical protein